MKRQARRGHRRPALSLVALALGLLLSACADEEPAWPVPGGDAERGKQQIAAYGCGTCHVIPGVRDARGQVGPPLTQFARRSYIAGQLPNNANDLIRWIMAPTAVEPGTAMPDLGVGPQQARDMAAYLYTLR